jgi:NAD(P)-dependent dehydrogenase (short-subunit alcohol dehydrogenase family)
VGVRSSYVATHLAMPLLIASGKGLVAFTSASGAVHYSMGPAYGAHKAGLDKLAADMAVDFDHAKAPVTAVSIWMGAVLTDRLGESSIRTRPSSDICWRPPRPRSSLETSSGRCTAIRGLANSTGGP